MSGILNNVERTKTCGVYAIINSMNQRKYIGSSFDTRRRCVNHKCKLRKNKHPNAYLQADWNKCGEDKFSFVVLDICEQHELIDKEQKILDKIFDKQTMCYNIRDIAKSNRGFKHSKETRQKMSIAKTGTRPSQDCINASIDSLKGKTWEEIHGVEKTKTMRENMSQKTKERFSQEGKTVQSNRLKAIWQTEGHRERMSNIHKTRFEQGYKHHLSKRIAQMTLEGHLVAIFENAIIASKHTGLNAGVMRQVATGIKKTYSGFLWSYV